MSTNRFEQGAEQIGIFENDIRMQVVAGLDRLKELFARNGGRLNFALVRPLLGELVAAGILPGGDSFEDRVSIYYGQPEFAAADAIKADPVMEEVDYMFFGGERPDLSSDEFTGFVTAENINAINAALDGGEFEQIVDCLLDAISNYSGQLVVGGGQSLEIFEEEPGDVAAMFATHIRGTTNIIVEGVQLGTEDLTGRDFTRFTDLADLSPNTEVRIVCERGES